MTCGAARRLAWPDGAPRAVNSSVAAAEAHISDCAACRDFIADMRVMAERLASSAPRPSAPGEVRERLFASLARARSDAERTRARRVFIRWMAAAAASGLVVLAAGVWRLSSVRAPADIAVRLADDHRRVLHNDGINSADSVVVRQWLSGRVGFAVRVPVFTNSQLVGARVADVYGSRGAVLAYRVDGRDVSYYIVPAPGEKTGGGEMVGPPVVQVSSWSGYRIAEWSEPGLTHALVGDLPGSRLAGLAHECIRQMVASARVASRSSLAPP